jgi:hypothetical protein
MIIALARISMTHWAPLLFENADSIVLPLLEKSLREGAPAEFVMSSQLFLFPEVPIYLLATLFTDSPRMALALNAILNVVLMYGSFRIIAGLLAHRARHRFLEITIALVATTVFIVIVLLEPGANVNLSGLATPLLTSTYYYGVILSGLIVVALTLWVSGSFGHHSWRARRTYIYAAAITVVSGLTTMSNPLFIMQAFAPLAAAALVLLIANLLTWRQFFVIVGWNLFGVVVGFFSRLAVPDLLPGSLAKYVVIDQIPTSIHLLGASVREMLASEAGTLRLIILLSVQVLTLALFAWSIWAKARPALAARITTANFFVISFASISSISLLIGMVATGSITTRYLEPLTVFPLLTILVAGTWLLRQLLVGVHDAALRRNLSRFGLGIAAAASAVLVAIGVLNAPTVASVVRGDKYTGADCINEFVGDSDMNGVASFWSARPLELYGDNSGDLLQVTTDLSPFEWMVNLGAYEDDTFSYVVLDGTAFLPKESLDVLGAPASVSTCEGREYWDYRGTPGEKTLTEIISRSLND